MFVVVCRGHVTHWAEFCHAVACSVQVIKKTITIGQDIYVYPLTCHYTWHVLYAFFLGTIAALAIPQCSQFCVTCSKLSTCRVDSHFDAKRLHLHEPSELLPPELNLDSSRYSGMNWLRNTATPRWVWWCLFIRAYFPTFCLGYRMVLFNLKVLEKFSLYSNCSQRKERV